MAPIADTEVPFGQASDATGNALEPSEPIQVAMTLCDWQSEDGSAPASPIATTVELQAHRIDITFADGRSIWVEQQDGAIRIHAYLPEKNGHTEPLNIDIGADGFFVTCEAPDADFEQTIKLRPNNSKPETKTNV